MQGKLIRRPEELHTICSYNRWSRRQCAGKSDLNICLVKFVNLVLLRKANTFTYALFTLQATKHENYSIPKSKYVCTKSFRVHK